MDDLELKQRVVIIKDAEIDDVLILDENYKFLIWKTEDVREKEQYKLLHKQVRQRISELKE